MIVDLSVSNFRSFREEQVLSLNAETGRTRHPSNYTLTEEGRLAILRSAAILGANASGKSNLIRAFRALQWMIVQSGSRKDGQTILPYEPFRLTSENDGKPVLMEVEFIVGSGRRYRYELSFTKRRVLEERLFSFARRSRALLFDRAATDTWETVRFGSSYRGGARKFSFFENATYLSRAGNDASASAEIREIYNYFQKLSFITPTGHLLNKRELSSDSMLRTVSELVCLADTGVSRVTVERKEVDDISLPDDMPEEIKEMVLDQNRISPRFWMEDSAGKLVEFDSDDMSDGTVRLLETLPPVLKCLASGSPLLFDDIDAHFHTDLVEIILRLFHDDEINRKVAQLIYSTHDTNVLNSSSLRRDQIWFVEKRRGTSNLKSLDEFNKKTVRQDSPFEFFYRDGRLGALPNVSFDKVKGAVVSALETWDQEAQAKQDA